MKTAAQEIGQQYADRTIVISVILFTFQNYVLVILDGVIYYLGLC